MSKSGGSYRVGELFHVPERGDLKFEEPREVVADRLLTIEEKRAVLASWASDACAVEGAPSLRRRQGSWQIVHIDEILEALRALDEQAGESGSSWIRRQVGRAATRPNVESNFTTGCGLLNIPLEEFASCVQCS